MKTRLGWTVVLALFVVAGGAWWWRARHDKPPEVKFVTTPLDKGRLVARVTATGTLSALVTVQVGSQVSGRIKEIHVDYNSPVKKGEVIAKIDPQLFVAAVEQARANFIAAQANTTKSRVQAEDAKRQLDRQKSLRDQKLVAQADLDTAQANYDAAVAQVAASQSAVEQTKAQLHQAEINLQYSTIYSPIDGVVISRAIDVGQTVAASLQAPTLFTIAEDLRKMQVDTSVAEADVGKLKAGMAATFTVDAYPNERFRGIVRQVRNNPTTVQNVVTYDAVIDVANPELKLKPGMTANVTFIYAERDDALKVPNAALRWKPPESLLPKREPGQPRPPGKRGRPEMPADQRTVWILRDGKPQQVSIRVGVSDGTQTEILEGEVQPGDPVITEYTGTEKTASPGGGPPPGRFPRGPF